ncbi:DnaB-like helicase N-terminal domain-containing protein [Rhodococcus ruber]|uniref:DnaB-like helicase N-terminal domain-containing protein n=1 Tax=Rhodococcus ruber TaxID=1830 RepID=UPI003784C91F
MTRPVRPVGPDPDPETLFVCGLLWANTTDARDVMRHVAPDDLQHVGTRAVFKTIARLIQAGRPHDTTTVVDELQRCGDLGGPAGDLIKRAWLDATTAGASEHPFALKSYASAVVSDAFRRRFETLGKALVEAAATTAENDLMPMLQAAGLEAKRHAKRLAQLRGDA